MLPARLALSHRGLLPPRKHIRSWGNLRLTFPCHKCPNQKAFSSPTLTISISLRGIGKSEPSPPFTRPISTSAKKMLIQEVEDQAQFPTELGLLPVEATLRRLLLDVAQYIDENPAVAGSESQITLPDDLADQPIVLRFTGGWVRDKLLGVESHDVDVAINKMTGYQFGLRLKEYLEITGNPEKYGLAGVATNDKQNQKAGASDKSKTVGGLHKIEANPEKSKHLETVTTRILGLDIDLVNLRKETYSDDSRNPQMEFGTPEEDALRRDATVNAMFYNINTQQVEDFTGRGYADLKNKVIRTPVEPFQTFKDDPLRVMRLVRFASRLNYKIDPQALEAMRNPDIKDALKRKISRERVGIELEKALNGPDPHEAMRLIFDLDLYETIFSDPTIETADHYQPDIGGWQTVIDFLQETVDSDAEMSEILVRDKEDRYLAWQLSAMVPYRDAPQPEAPEPGRRAPPLMALSVAREGIKATNKVCDVISAAVRHQEEICELVDKVYEQLRRPDKKPEVVDATTRDGLGMAIRRWGASWRSQVAYAMLVDVTNDTTAVDVIRRKYKVFLNHLHKLSILDAYAFKPLLDGKTLAKALDTAPGPWMKDALDVVMAYQLRHPETATSAEAIAAVKQARQNGGELPSALVRHFLELTIRPLFSKAKPSSITDSGRKNTAAALPPKMTMSLDEAQTKPWKNAKEAFALDLLQWCVSVLRPDLIAEVWHALIPPLLTLVDDWEAKYKRLGVALVKELLAVIPANLLLRTGVGDVFEDALMPCLTCIPPITPEEDSIPLLNQVYPALIALANVRYSSAEFKPLLIKFLDTVIRKGIIYGYTHCSTHPRVVSTFLTHLASLLNEEGVECVKHLKYILPMLTETLSHPLVDTKSVVLLDVLLHGIKTLQAVILNAWPRMTHHRGEVLKGLTLCWLKVSTGPDVQEDAASYALREEMREAVKMLRAAVERDVDFNQDCQMLLDAEPRLAGLFHQIMEQKA